MSFLNDSLLFLSKGSLSALYFSESTMVDGLDRLLSLRNWAFYPSDTHRIATWRASATSCAASKTQPDNRPTANTKDTGRKMPLFTSFKVRCVRMYLVGTD
uniref:Uncharacterized protein n=1 Tax=Coccidioides posadasii RMSCC 3488 TaxID=454284 RepID=A0A0J6FG21_COCPO|nr:hypothetical protein CPAG_05549 [Coccidioides posadasii RMSCC 3488]